MDITTSSATRVIDLAELQGADEFPAYAAVFSQHSDQAFVLSPASMRWSKHISLAHLQNCKPFWQAQKKKLRCKLSELFAPLLRHHYGDEYIAVLGNHPWQCLLYLGYQQRQRASGLFLLQSRLDQNIYKTLGWDDWFSLQQDLLPHWLLLNPRGFNPASFRARQQQLQRFVQRIGVETPFAMSSADGNAIQRRFGKWLGQIWRWSFNETGDLHGFPWIALQAKSKPGVERDLEYPVNQWSFIEVLLREDLQRLCEQMQRDDCEHINRMCWRITLFNYQSISVELSFRHPYSLHRDQPGFDTALYQARYLYEDLMRKLQARDTDLDLPQSMPFLNWNIEVTERVMLAPQLWDLFAAEFDQIDYQQVLALQNKLPLAFECYQANASFFPEHSFRAVAPGEPTATDGFTWSCGASNKPLFCYPSAQPIETPSPMQRIFLERSSEQWWLSQDALQSIRDYFILKDRNGRASWAFRNQAGSWFKQGEYY